MFLPIKKHYTYYVHVDFLTRRKAFRADGGLALAAYNNPFKWLFYVFKLHFPSFLASYKALCLHTSAFCVANTNRDKDDINVCTFARTCSL